jgi:hypothetical protein
MMVPSCPISSDDVLHLGKASRPNAMNIASATASPTHAAFIGASRQVFLKYSVAIATIRKSSRLSRKAIRRVESMPWPSKYVEQMMIILICKVKNEGNS